MSCLFWRRRSGGSSSKRHHADHIAAVEKQRELESLPPPRPAQRPRRVGTNMSTTSSNSQYRATTEFRWPARISERPNTGVSTMSSTTTQQQPLDQTNQRTRMQLPQVPEKEVIVSSNGPRHLQSPGGSMMSLPQQQEQYHISPQAYAASLPDLLYFHHQQEQQQIQGKIGKYAGGPPYQNEPAELPPHHEITVSELHSDQPQELLAEIPEQPVFPQELEGDATPATPTMIRPPRSRFSYQRGRA